MPRSRSGMPLQHRRLLLGGLAVVMPLLLAACDSAGGGSSNGNGGRGSTQGSTHSAASNAGPQLVAPKDLHGSAGKGPLVISSPIPVPGGKPGSQQIVLGDRTFIINSVGKERGARAASTLINLDVAVQNTSDAAIMNQSTFYQLMGPEGDVFGYQYNSSDNFYGAIAAHTTRSGTIVFELPTAAASSLRLLYRSEIATETTIISLRVP